MQIRLTQKELSKLAQEYITNVLKLKISGGEVDIRPYNSDGIYPTYGRISFIYECEPIEQPKPGDVVSDSPTERKLDSTL